jgi:hypothetical protein
MPDLLCPLALRYDKRQKWGETYMALTAQEVFTETVRDLPPSERLRLAALILQDLAQSEVAVVDRSDTWTEQDQRDVTTFSLQYAAELYPEDEELV